MIERRGRSRCKLKEVNYPSNAIDSAERVGTIRKHARKKWK
jgi:hypothetical protein